MRDKGEALPSRRNDPFGQPWEERPSHAVVALPVRHEFEDARLASLVDLERFVYPEDAPMASLARQAAVMAGAPIGLVSLMEEFDQRVIGRFGMDVERVERKNTICTHTILQPDVLVVEDTALDPRFRDLPAVVGKPHVRFYAGAPIFDVAGLPVGTVCVVDDHPRDLSSRSLFALQRLATLTLTVLETRRLFSEGRDPHFSTAERKSAEGRLDGLLLTLVEPRSTT